jgi:hypothetical protein
MPGPSYIELRSCGVRQATAYDEKCMEENNFGYHLQARIRCRWTIKFVSTIWQKRWEYCWSRILGLGVWNRIHSNDHSEVFRIWLQSRKELCPPHFQEWSKLTLVISSDVTSAERKMNMKKVFLGSPNHNPSIFQVAPLSIDYFIEKLDDIV